MLSTRFGSIGSLSSIIHRLFATLGDAAIEFRVLHHRVLLEFFYGPPKHENNIVAWEYIDDWRKGHDPKMVQWLDDYMDRCHTMLAHISTSRSEMARQGLKSWGAAWPITEAHLDSIIPQFLAGLPPDYRADCRKQFNQILTGPYKGNGVLRLFAQYLD